MTTEMCMIDRMNRVDFRDRGEKDVFKIGYKALLLSHFVSKIRKNIYIIYQHMFFHEFQSSCFVISRAMSSRFLEPVTIFNSPSFFVDPLSK